MKEIYKKDVNSDILGIPTWFYIFILVWSFLFVIFLLWCYYILCRPIERRVPQSIVATSTTTGGNIIALENLG